jgi:membrane associated rhomboid family serine protease
MSDAAMPPLELILRQCATAAPQPWYPRQYAQQTGASREALDPHLDRLRLGGFVQLTEWTQEHGQGYQLTQAGKELLERPRLLEGLRRGNLPEVRVVDPEPVAQPQAEIEGDKFREMLASATPFRPRVTIALLWINIAVFSVGLMLAQRAGLSMADYFGARGTEAYIRVLMQQGAMRGIDIAATGQWWRLLTCAFVHIGILHLVVNMVSLWFVGPAVERLLGSARYLLFYLLTALGGSFGVLIDSPAMPTAGASGALWGLMGGLAVYVFANRRSLPPPVFQSWFRQLVGVILLNAFLTFQVAGISKGAHFGGGLAGALLIVPVDALRLRRGTRAILAALAIVIIAGAGFGYAHRSLEQGVTRHGATQTQRREELDEFNTSYVRRIGKQDVLAERLARESSSELRAFENRDADDVRKLRQQIADLTQSMNGLKDDLGKVGPYHVENVEDARQTGIRLMTANIALLARIDDCLQHVNRCDTEKEENAVQKERAHWKSLLE